MVRRALLGQPRWRRPRERRLLRGVMTAKARILIGISGWRYAPWRGVFYPEKLPQSRELEYASRMLPTIEINGSFYSLQRPAVVRAVVRRHAARLRVRREGAEVHHAHAAAEGCARRRWRTSLRRGCSSCATSSGRSCGSFRLSCLRRRALRQLLRDAAARYGRGRRARAQPRSPRRGPREPRDRPAAPAAPRGRDPARQLHRRGIRRDCCGAIASRSWSRTPPASGRCSRT